VDYAVTANTSASARLSTLLVGGRTFTLKQGATLSCPLTLGPTAGAFDATGGSATIHVTTDSSCSWSASSSADWITLSAGRSGSGPGSLVYSVAAFSGGGTRGGTISILGATYQVTQSASGAPALRFVPVTPCRLVDTRTKDGFGGTKFAAGESRSIRISSGSCSIPDSAAAYSLNVAVVPTGKLGRLALYPAGIPRPEVYTLLSPDGRIRSTAAIVAAGADTGVEVYASDETDVVLDINGYFAASSSALQFYPVTPCRLVDTRLGAGDLGGPVLPAGGTRTFPIRGVCQLPSSAQAYSVNLAAVPAASLGYLTAWPTGVDRPLVASLNAPTGAITSNAAIIPAGTNGSINLYANDATHVVIDVNGYFAPAGTGGLSFYTLAPCRALDASIAGSQTVALLSTDCALPSRADAYSLTATALPDARLGYLTLWPTGVTQPLVATLNASDGTATSNAALVPAGTGGFLSAYLTDLARLVIDLNGYFAK
jgi:serine protease